MNNTNDTGEQHKFSHVYTLWFHDISNNDWSINSYEKIATISNISEFWQIFNNFERLGYRTRHFFLMKDDIEPIWEHEQNRNGGVCSFRIELNNSLPVWEYLNAAMVCDKLSTDSSDINGISISPRSNWAIIKVWNRDQNKDLTKLIHNDILVKYSHLSIKYKSNAPEY